MTRMDAILFSVKRINWAALRFGESWLKEVGLTPARFDMLYSMFRARSHSALQRDLWRTLGVSRMTVSVMVRALEKLGFVKRTPRGNTLLVELTREALWRLRYAGRVFVRGGLVRKEVERLFVDDFSNADRCFDVVSQLDDWLVHARTQAYDTATLAYPWRPEE